MRKWPALLLATVLVSPAFTQGTTATPPAAGTTDQAAPAKAKKKTMKKEKKMKKAPAAAPGAAPATTP